MSQLSSSRLSHAATALTAALVVLCVISFDNLRIDALLNKQEMELDSLESKPSASDSAAGTTGKSRSDLADQRMKLMHSQRREMGHQLRWRNLWTMWAFIAISLANSWVIIRNTREAKAAKTVS